MNAENHNHKEGLAEKQVSTHEKNKYPSGIKWTKQRKDVYDVLFLASEPLSAVQIYNHIEKTEKSGNYAISTIYRILTAFEEKNLVTKTNWMGDGTVVYELNKGGHTHYALCLKCHKRIPLEACPFEHMHIGHTESDCEHMTDDPKLAAEDFVVTGHKIELYGYCKGCQIDMN